jgi:hypothetical protein
VGKVRMSSAISGNDARLIWSCSSVTDKAFIAASKIR